MDKQLKRTKELVEKNRSIADSFLDMLKELQETVGFKSKTMYISFEYHDRIKDEKD